MEPVKFKGYNIIVAENQPGYKPLPVFRDNGPQGTVVSCWKLSFRERLRVLFQGNIWLSMMTFHKPVTPGYMSTKRSDVLTIDT